MFEENKNAEELGIDKTRKFRVCVDCCAYHKGDILELKKDDGSDCPFFWNLTADRGGTKHPKEEKWSCWASWSDLEYADEETETPQQFKHIFLCPTKQDWLDICQWLEDNTYLRWSCGKKPTEYEDWDFHKEQTALCVDSEINFCDEEYYRENYIENYTDYTFITVKEFLNKKSNKPNIKTLWKIGKIK